MAPGKPTIMQEIIPLHPIITLIRIKKTVKPTVMYISSHHQVHIIRCVLAQSWTSVTPTPINIWNAALTRARPFHVKKGFIPHPNAVNIEGTFSRHPAKRIIVVQWGNLLPEEKLLLKY